MIGLSMGVQGVFVGVVTCFSKVALLIDMARPLGKDCAFVIFAKQRRAVIKMCGACRQQYRYLTTWNDLPSTE